jgi:alkylation response protein AidB-like acyl-CoA dehydrogenase
VQFFTSATLSETAFALARVIDDKTGPAGVAGSRGLSLFYIQLRDDEGNLKNIKIRRLKEKLGTKSLPTAELELCGTPARLVGQVGRGVATIATLFNITRIYSASASVAAMRKAIAVARDYAHRRHAFGKPIAELPLHVQTLAQQEVAYRGCLQLLFHTVLLEVHTRAAHTSRT